jgi:hypothetical protein
VYPAKCDENLPELFQTGAPVSRAKIVALQDALSSSGDCDDMDEFHATCLVHYHAPGVYARELFIPAGTLIIGKIHKHAHHNNISLGKIAVATEFDSYVITAPHSFVSLPGTKRVVYALEDTIWTTYHHTDTADLAVIEESTIAATYDDFDQYVSDTLQLEKGG